MPTTITGPWQYSIGPDSSVLPSLIYGGPAGSPANGIYVQETQTDTGTMTVQDQPVVGHDGLLFGVDTMAGMVITQTGNVWLNGNPAGAMDAYSTLAGFWNDPTIRLTPGAVQVLRAWYPGSSVVRRCYGRGRKIMPTYGTAYAGLVPFTAQFQAADGIWYSDTEYSLPLTMAPSYLGGITPPITPPLQLSSQANYQQNTVINTGAQPTWPKIKFIAGLGSLTNPGLIYNNTPVAIGYTGVLKPGAVLEIDTRPWKRTALLNGTNAAGYLSGAAMISMQLFPGSTSVRFTGQDATGTGQCVVSWRNASLSIGGSQ